MEDFEKLGSFYLGRGYDLTTGGRKDDLLLYDAKDLVTHAVCVGMTGSGKTGLCVALLEEAALDGVPAIVIDPKGDLCDLMLTFPELRAIDFRPWVNEDDAAREGVTPDAYAFQEAERWRQGLAEWGEDGARIARLQSAADIAVYTPGSTAGLPVSILASFAPPPPGVLADDELLRDRVGTAVTSLLGLLGIEADAIRSREYILLAAILDRAWRGGGAVNLEELVRQVQRPPLDRVGALDLESFYPAAERFELAMALNNLLASPSFAAWMQGDPLDVGRLLATPEGRPRIAVFSIAHLDDASRMFFVSLLLNEVLGWVRSQPGTSSLRALVYMDEIFGYFPPVANPPSKTPLLTLLKQARAFGVGMVLTTQNPVDLDYKGLANAGTWFLGRLQTERDKERVLEGLEGVAAGAATPFDREAMGRTLAGLGNRVFLMYNVHDDSPEVFQTRWTLSYLPGPLTREQIKVLMAPRKGEPALAASQTSPVVSPPAVMPAAAPPPAGAATSVPGGPSPGEASGSAGRPLLPPEIAEYFVPVRGAKPVGSGLVYRPAVLGAGTVRVVDPKTSVDTEVRVSTLADLGDGTAVEWDAATVLSLPVADLEQVATEPASFAPLSSPATRPASFAAWQRDFAGWLYRTQTVELLKSPTLGLVSSPGESEGEFRVRLGQAGRERRDEMVEQLRQKYAAKLAAADERVRRAEQAVDREAEQAKGAELQTAISFGATLLGAFMGRKKLSTSTLGRATTAARGVGRAADQRGDVDRAKETVASLQQARADLDTAFAAEVQALEAKLDPLSEVLEPVVLRPKKADIAVQVVALAWVPYWVDAAGSVTGSAFVTE